MSFEILNRDLAGRIGRLETRRGSVDTPLLLPVVSPTLRLISPEEMQRDFGCQAIIANAYLMKKNYSREVLTRGIHDFLQFDGTIMTDSGGYQILVYGDVEVSPEEIIKFQEEIGSDIGVILDIPTGWNAKRAKAEYTVDETLKRAEAALPLINRKDIMWVGPVQGGNHLDLVTRSATEIGKLPFDIYALGSPTQVVEQYLFDVLVDMIAYAKRCLPMEKPLHLFGAGHPFMLSFAVAMGCDIFDSAAYALFARRGKYMTNYGTVSLKDLQYFPCSCKVCSEHTPRELSEMSSKEREYLIAWHNLNTCYTEIKRIKQAINEGRLWELLELRARSHPSLFKAFKRLREYSSYLEAGTPISKGKGLLYFDSLGLVRPEVTRYHDRIKRWMPPSPVNILVLLPQPTSKPFHRSKEYRQLLQLLSKKLGRDMDKIHLCTYVVPWGLVPLELDETYPLSQFEVTFPPDDETVKHVTKEVEDYIRKKRKYCAVVLHSNPIFGEKLENACEKAVGPGELFISPKGEDIWDDQSFKNIVNTVYIALRGCSSQKATIENA